jgi:hypothetical protein
MVALGIAGLILAHPRVMNVGRLNIEAVQAIVKGSSSHYFISRLSQDRWAAVASWLQGRGQPHIVVATKDPWGFHLRTHISALILPDAQSSQLLLRFLKENSASYVLLAEPPEDLHGPERRLYAESFAPETYGPVFQTGDLRLYAVPNK